MQAATDFLNDVIERPTGLVVPALVTLAFFPGNFFTVPGDLNWIDFPRGPRNWTVLLIHALLAGVALGLLRRNLPQHAP